ncbi:hypothetical protein LLG88_13730 [bacterium]|nr:hypothetical protein [bacterium]
MAIVLETTTGTQANVDEALGLKPETPPAPGEGGGGKADELPKPADPPAAAPAAAAATPAAGEPVPAAPAAGDEGDEGDEDEGGGEPEPGTEREARSSRSKLHTIKVLRQQRREAESKVATLEGTVASQQRILDEILKGRTPAPGAAEPAAAAPPVPTAPAAPVVPADDPEPQVDDEKFTSYQDYDKAHDAWRDRQMERRIDAKVDERLKAIEAKRSTETAAAEAGRVRQETIKTFATAHPDYDEVTVNNPDLMKQITEPMGAWISHPRNAMGPAVLYHLGSHLDEAARIAALPPFEAHEALVMLSQQLKGSAAPAGKPAAPGAATSAAPVPKAPQPPTPVRGSSAAPSETFEERAQRITPGSPEAVQWMHDRNKEERDRLARR